MVERDKVELLKDILFTDDREFAEKIAKRIEIIEKTVHKTYLSNKIKKALQEWLLIILLYVKIKEDKALEENHPIKQQPKKLGCKVQK